MQAKHYDTGHENHPHVSWTGALRVKPQELRALYRRGSIEDCIRGWETSVEPKTGLVRLLPKPNLVVNVGFQFAMDLNFNISARQAVRTMGVDNGTTNPTATSVSSTSGGGTDTGSTSRRLVAFDATFPSRSASVMSAAGTLTQATVAFTMKRLFLSRAAAGTTDAANDLYSMTNVFTIDLSAFSTWSQTFTATVTGSGS